MLACATVNGVVRCFAAGFICVWPRRLNQPMVIPASLRCAIGTGPCVYGCAFHKWLDEIKADESCGMPTAPIPGLLTGLLTSDASAPSTLVPTGTYRAAKRRCRTEHTPAVKRLLAFIKLSRKFGRAPWAASSFDVNEAIFFRLASAHLHLIVGKEGASAERQSLLRILAARHKLEGSGNLVWVTNRQQGKTTTIGRFLALLAVTSDAGGLLATVYSTSLDRAQELVKSTKQFLYWHQQTGGNIKFVRDCERSFVLRNAYTDNEVAARPKAVDSCRGDAPSAAFFDEVGFVDQNFWYKFAFPLLQVTGRVFTLITTPPPSDGFFAQFVEQVKARNAAGDHFFSLVNHSLACAPCIKVNEAERCCHKLHLIPPWKSILRFTAMKRLIPRSKKGTFAAEVFGVIGGDDACYFPRPLVAAALGRTVRLETCRTIWVGVDPASHSKSDMGLTALGVNSSGLHVILGLAAVNVARCEMSQLTAIVRQFASRLKTMYPQAKFVPIIEANNNEVAATTLLRAFGPGVCMPFTANRFSTYIAEDIGVLTTQATKMSMIQQTYLAIINGAIAVSDRTVVADRTSFEPLASPALFVDLVGELGAQLGRFSDRPDGTISGKTFVGTLDNLFCSTRV